MKLDSYFDTVIGGDSGFGNKSNGNSALSATKGLNIMPEYAITIGDAPADDDMAKNANLKGSILVSTGQISIIELLKINKFSINSLSELYLVA